jgi:hypothetical protein
MSRVVAAVALAGTLAGCLSINSPDLFLLTRTGLGDKLILLINDGGTIRCNDRAPRPLAEPLLLRARDLVSSLASDAKQHLTIPATPHSVAYYTMRLQDGTISFPDTAAATHSELARAELFAVQTARQACGLQG